MSIELPNLPLPRELAQRAAKHAIEQAEVETRLWVAMKVAPRTADYIGRRSWFPMACVRRDEMYARRLSLFERVRLALIGRAG